MSIKSDQVEIDNAKEILRYHGFYVDNLWHVDDVLDRCDVTNEEAYDILDDVLTGDVIAYINESIQDYIDNKFKI
jgi:hypothetical protein